MIKMLTILLLPMLSFSQQVEGFRPDGYTTNKGKFYLAQRKVVGATRYFDFGRVDISYREAKDSVIATVKIFNDGDDTLRSVSFYPFALDFKKMPNGFLKNQPYTYDNIWFPGFIKADSLMCESDMEVGIYPTSKENIWRYFSKANIELTKGQSCSYTIIWSVNGTSRQTIDAYNASHQFMINWPDRRPVGAVFLSSYKPMKWQNPRNWVFVDESKDVAYSYGDAFKERLFKFADLSIKELKKCNAQGVIIWDIEGQQFGHPLSYGGAPELLSLFSPEMDAVADELFKKFRMEGLKVGITIRPDSVYSLPFNTIWRVNVSDPERVIINRIKYAQARWGCSMFYVDSNVDDKAGLLHPSVFYEVAKACPDVLVIPEHENSAYYRFSVPYLEARRGDFSIPNKNVFPGAFGVMNLADAKNPKAVVEQAKKDGSIILFRGWYADPLNKILYENN